VIDISVQMPDLGRIADNLIPTPQDWLLLAADAADIMKKRTQAGRDVYGAPFQEYSEDYGKFREENGRYRNPVNLTYHGRMLASMAVKRIPLGAAVYFRDAERSVVAYKHNTGQGVPQRTFFGLSETELQRLNDKLADVLRSRT
jgi:hypothetical protein